MTTWGPSKRQTAKSRQPNPPARPARQNRPEQPAGDQRGARRRRRPRARVHRHRPDRRRRAHRAGDLLQPRRPARAAASRRCSAGSSASAATPIPVGLVAAGVALVSKGRSSSPVRLGIGWGMIAMAVVGIAHIVNGPDGVARPRRHVHVGRADRRDRCRAAAGPARPGRRVHPPPRPRHRRCAVDHPHVGQDDGDAHERRRRLGRPAARAGLPARRCATCRR